MSIALLLLALPAGTSAKDEKKDAKAGPPIRVAVFPPLNSSEEQGVERIMDDILRDQLKKVEATRATFIWPADVERLLGDSDQLIRIDQLNERWARSGQVDSTAVAGLDSLLLVDAILLVRIVEWENHRVPVVGAGQSHATVALSFALFDPRTKKLLWTKKPREQRFSAELDASSSNVNYDETGVIQRKSDNAPPRYEIVAADLVRDAFKKFPRG
jgi:hypothetical protein